MNFIISFTCLSSRILAFSNLNFNWVFIACWSINLFWKQHLAFDVIICPWAKSIWRNRSSQSFICMTIFKLRNIVHFFILSSFIKNQNWLNILMKKWKIKLKLNITVFLCNIIDLASIVNNILIMDNYNWVKRIKQWSIIMIIIER